MLAVARLVDYRVSCEGRTIVATEEWQAEAEGIREAVRQLAPRGRRRRYAPARRERIVRYLEVGAAGGMKREALAEAAGVPLETTDRWRRLATGATGDTAVNGLVAVQVKEGALRNDDRRLVVVTPAGFRLEGLARIFLSVEVTPPATAPAGDPRQGFPRARSAFRESRFRSGSADPVP